MPCGCKEDIINLTKKYFELPDTEKVKKWVLASIGHKWKEFKHDLKNKHFQPEKTKEAIENNVPTGVFPEQWNKLVQYWFSEKSLVNFLKNITNILFSLYYLLETNLIVIIVIFRSFQKKARRHGQKIIHYIPLDQRVLQERKTNMRWFMENNPGKLNFLELLTRDKMEVSLIIKHKSLWGLSKANHALAETRRKFLEAEARKKDQAVNPQTITGKRPAETVVEPPLKKRKPNTTRVPKLIADAMRSARPVGEIAQTAKPDIGGYWSTKLGAQGSFENETILNDLDEALGQVGEVQRNYNQTPGSIHVQKGKTELLSLYARLRTLENELLQNVADKATIERLEKEIAEANSSIASLNAGLASANANLASATAALFLRDEEIKNLKAKIASDAKSHEDALGEAEYTAGVQAFYYGEMLMAYFSLAHPETNFTDPQFAVPEPEDVAKFNKMPDAKEYLRDYVRRWMKGPMEETKPSTTVTLDEVEEVPPEAGEGSIPDQTLPLDHQASAMSKQAAKEDAPIVT